MAVEERGTPMWIPESELKSLPNSRQATPVLLGLGGLTRQSAPLELGSCAPFALHKGSSESLSAAPEEAEPFGEDGCVGFEELGELRRKRSDSDLKSRLFSGSTNENDAGLPLGLELHRTALSLQPTPDSIFGAGLPDTRENTPIHSSLKGLKDLVQHRGPLMMQASQATDIAASRNQLLAQLADLQRVREVPTTSPARTWESSPPTSGMPLGLLPSAHLEGDEVPARDVLEIGGQPERAPEEFSGGYRESWASRQDTPLEMTMESLPRTRESTPYHIGLSGYFQELRNGYVDPHARLNQALLPTQQPATTSPSVPPGINGKSYLVPTPGATAGPPGSWHGTPAGPPGVFDMGVRPPFRPDVSAAATAPSAPKAVPSAAAPVPQRKWSGSTMEEMNAPLEKKASGGKKAAAAKAPAAPKAPAAAAVSTPAASKASAVDPQNAAAPATPGASATTAPPEASVAVPPAGGDSAEAAEQNAAASTLPPPTVGSVGHPHTCALPCKYFCRSRGCKDGPSCIRCHLCHWHRKFAKPDQPETEIQCQ